MSTEPSDAEREATLAAEFKFELPLLASGEYTIDAAIADGTQENHVPHHWIYDAQTFRVDADCAVRGLVGIPMTAIDLRVHAAEPAPLKEAF